MTQQKPSANSATPAAYHAQTAKRGGKEVSPREKGYTDQQVLSEVSFGEFRFQTSACSSRPDSTLTPHFDQCHNGR